MKISNIELEYRMERYRNMIPRLNWFTPEEQIELVLKAERNSKACKANFLITLENLAHIESVYRGKKPAA